MLTDEALAGHYSMDYYGGAESKFSAIFETLVKLLNRRRARRLIARLPGTHADSPRLPLRVLDVGCGRAMLLTAFASAGAECHGLERAEFPGDPGMAGIQLHRETLCEIGFPDSHFDIVVIWHVLEHLRDPLATLRECKRILKPGGVLALAVPNLGSWQAHWFGAYWFHLDLPRHLYHFTLQSLSACIETAGLSCGAWSTYSVEQNIYGFLQSALNRGSFDGPPNQLYAWIKSQPARPLTAVLVAQIVVAALILPVALAEYLLSGMLGRGATLTLYATKRTE
jgi:SAM-dependent methyltransferase